MVSRAPALTGHHPMTRPRWKATPSLQPSPTSLPHRVALPCAPVMEDTELELGPGVARWGHPLCRCLLTLPFVWPFLTLFYSQEPSASCQQEDTTDTGTK